MVSRLFGNQTKVHVHTNLFVFQRAMFRRVYFLSRLFCRTLVQTKAKVHKHWLLDCFSTVFRLFSTIQNYTQKNSLDFFPIKVTQTLAPSLFSPITNFAKLISQIFSLKETYTQFGF